MSEQTVFYASDNYKELDDYWLNHCISSVFLVCDQSLPLLRLNQYIKKMEEQLGIRVVKFSDFQPNPLYESVEKGIELFHQTACQMIMAVGGGNAIDVAKCIKLYSNMDSTQNYLEQPIVPNEIPFLAVPTTAGTGSEATKYAVIYYKGLKQSVSDESCIPSAVLMDASALETLPIYQKKATMMDAFCHAIESFWSVNSTEESKNCFAKEAIQMILKYKDSYLRNVREGNEQMMKAANLAGKAINITQTTAGHAMCYKITSLYHIAHGHAAALCVKQLWPYMIHHLDACIDKRGDTYLKEMFHELALIMGCQNAEEAPVKFANLIDELGLQTPDHVMETDFDELAGSVNPVRLKNNPVKLDNVAILSLYQKMLKKEIIE